MKNGKAHLFKTLTIAAILLLAGRSHALFTPYLSGVSNGIADYATTLTDPSDRAEARVVARVLKDLSKPSTSVAGDYSLLLRAALHLGPFALRPPFGEVGSNAFVYFMGEAQTELVSFPELAPAVLWEKVGAATIDVIADGCRTLAMLWESAWVEGRGPLIPAAELQTISRPRLQKIYERQGFVPSVALKDIDPHL